MTENSLAVGLGEIKVSDSPLDVLVAYGLGSCVGVGFYDPVKRVAGLLHAVLPERVNGSDPVLAKYVDTGIQKLVAEVEALGALRSRLVVRMAGGATMLLSPGVNMSFNIGERNVAKAQATLKALSFRITAQEVGGNSGRTVRLYVADGRMTVRVLGNQEREI